MTMLEKIIDCYESITPLQATIALSVLVLYISYLFLRDKGVPPGPKGVPLLGYWPFLKTDDICHFHMLELGKKYGDVFSFRVAGTLLIRLGSLKSIREAHLTKSECFGGRYKDSILSDFAGNGLPFVNGEIWKVLRKFFVSKFKDYGMNAIKENVASSVYDSLKATVEDLHNTKGSPMHISDLVTKTCIIIFRRIIFNDQGITEEELQAINDEYKEAMKGLTTTNMMLIGKFAKYCMFPFMRSICTSKRHLNRIDSILLDVVRRHKAEYDESYADNLIHCYFKEREEKRKKGDAAARHYTDKALLESLSQLTTDGIQVICVFIENLLVMLVKHPEEQEKIYKEILDVVGTGRLPTIEDKTKLPYTNAFIYEVTRFTDFLPLFPSLQCTKETTVSGYKIPIGSVTLYDFYAAHRNPNDFENPDEFNPSRYLSSSGKQRPDLPIIFGIGKRSCIGEGFSMIQAFLFLTTIVQNFRLSFPQDSKGLSTKFWSEEKLEICAHPRSHKSHSK